MYHTEALPRDDHFRSLDERMSPHVRRQLSLSGVPRHEASLVISTPTHILGMLSPQFVQSAPPSSGANPQDQDQVGRWRNSVVRRLSMR